jgi:hypothetical protein
MERAIRLILALTFAASAAHAQSGSAGGYSGSHGDGHAEMHDIYKNWTPPDNPKTSCCDNSDCRPTRAYVDESGNWRAWNGNMWLIVPSARVLPTDYAHDGRSHLCEKAGFIYCFAPGPPKS